MWASVVAATVTLLAAAGCGGDDDGDAAASGGGGDDGGYDCPIVETEVDSDLPIEVAEAGVCSYGYGSEGHFASFGLVVENTGTEPLVDVELGVEADTADGRVELRPMGDQIEVLPGGGRIGIGHGVALEERVEIETLVLTVDQPDRAADADEMPIGRLFVRDESTTLGDDGERTNSFTAGLALAEEPLEDVPVYVIYRDDAGAIVGGALDSMPRLDPEVLDVEHSFADTYPNPDVVGIEVYIDAPLLPTGGGGTRPDLDVFCDELATAGIDPMEIRSGLRVGGPEATALLGQLEGMTPPAEIADAWNAMMAGGGRPTEVINDPLREAVNDVSSYILDNCGIPGLG
jgi:hypothetical protein